jgi:hypothetical protein
MVRLIAIVTTSPLFSHTILKRLVQIFTIIGQIGLALLMSLIGLEGDFGRSINNRRTMVAVSIR